MGFFQKYPGVLRAVIVAVAALAATIVVLNVALTVATLVASPYILIILAIVAAFAAVIAIGVLVWKNWDKISAALSAAWDGITNAANSAVDQVVAAFRRLVSIVTGAVSGFVNWLRSNWQPILAILGGPLGLAVVLLARYWDQITAAVRSAVDLVKSLWNGLSSFVSSSVAKIGGYLTSIGGKFDAVADGARDAVSSVKSAINGMISWIEGKVGAVGRAASSIASALKSPINSFISAWNGTVLRIPRITIPTLDTKLPGVGKIGGGSAGGQSFSFPYISPLAKGGVIDAPTLALVGEAGREIVTPEDLLRDIVGEGGGDSFTLNLYVRTADEASIAYGFRRLELLRTGR